MGRVISIVFSAAIGVVLAGFAAFGIVTSQTAAPSNNPAGSQIVDYGNR